MMREQFGAVIVAQNQTTYNTIRSVIASAFTPVSWATSMAQAKQKLQQETAVLIVNTPAADEFGVDSAIEIAMRDGVPVMVLVQQDIYERTVYRTRNTGVFVLARPLKGQILLECANLLLTMQRRFRGLKAENERLSRRLEEMSLVTRAKCVLIEKRGMTENEAHRFLETEAMNNSITKKEAAKIVLREYDIS